MNNYKKLINLIKPEFQDLYGMTKNVGEDNTFQLCSVSLKDSNKTFNTVMTFRNTQNTMIVMKNGKNPYISDVASIYSKDIYKHLNIPDEVSDFVYATINLNNKKNEMNLFFDNIFSGSGLLRNYKCSTSVKVRVSNDYSTVDYILIEHVYDVTFRKDSAVLQNSDFVKNISLFGKIKTYVKKKNIIIDVHNRNIIIENLEDEDGNGIQEIFTLEEFTKNDIFMVDDIKKRAKEYLQMKIDDIDAFEWSQNDDN